MINFFVFVVVNLRYCYSSTLCYYIVKNLIRFILHFSSPKKIEIEREREREKAKMDNEVRKRNVGDSLMSKDQVIDLKNVCCVFSFFFISIFLWIARIYVAFVTENYKTTRRGY